MKKNLGMLLLAVYLILAGLSVLVSLPLGMVNACVAIAAGVLIILGK